MEEKLETEREILEAVLRRIDAIAQAMRPPNPWTPELMSVAIAARNELIKIDAALTKP